MCETKNFYLVVAQILALTGLIILLLWVSLRPRSPNYSVVNFSIPTPTDSNSSSSSNNGNQSNAISFDLIINNPNKYYKIYYDNINLTLNYGSDESSPIGDAILNAFHVQDKDRTDHFHQSINADGRLWNVAMKAVLNGTAEIRVKLLTKIRYRMWGKTGKHHAMKMQGRVPIGKDGKIKGKKKKIKLRKSRRIK